MKTTKTDPVAELKQDKIKMKKKERKKVMKEKKNKEEKLEVEGQTIIDVAEEIGKLGSKEENVSKKKRKNTGWYSLRGLKCIRYMAN